MIPLGAVASSHKKASSAVASVVLRGTTSGKANSSSVTITYPAGIAVGDLLVVAWGSSFRRNNLPGFTILADYYQSYFNGGLAYKVATSADVTAGAVTLTLAGSDNGSWSCVAATVGTFDTNNPVMLQNYYLIGGPSSLPQTLAAYTSSTGSLSFHFASRSSGTTQTLQCSVGTLVWAAWDATATGNAGALYKEVPSVSRQATWSAATTTSGTYGEFLLDFDILPPYTGPSYASAISPSLEGWWKFDETSGTVAADSSGKGRNATYGSTATLSQPTIRTAGVCSARATNGALATIPYATWMNAAQFTVNVWTNPTSTGSNLGTVGRYSSRTDEWLLYQTSGHYSGWLNNYQVTDNAAEATATPYMLTLTYDGSTAKFYRNGTLVASAAMSIGTPASTTGIGFGAYSDGGGGASDAYLQDASFHSAALTASQIQTIYKAGLG